MFRPEASQYMQDGGFNSRSEPKGRQGRGRWLEAKPKSSVRSAAKNDVSDAEQHRRALLERVALFERPLRDRESDVEIEGDS